MVAARVGTRCELTALPRWGRLLLRHTAGQPSRRLAEVFAGAGALSFGRPLTPARYDDEWTIRMRARIHAHTLQRELSLRLASRVRTDPCAYKEREHRL